MSEIKRPLKVFLCHAHADRDPVHAFYIRLVKDGVDAWLDKEKLLPGQEWELEIRKAVREADVVVVCLSQQFNEAGFRQKEVRLALDTAMEKPEGEIFIIPARLEECDTLESLKKWHWVDLFEDDGYDKFLRALRVRGDRIGAITYSLIRFDVKAEKGRKIKFLFGQAEKLEEDSKWADALEVYEQIKRILPSDTGVNQKIAGLQERVKKADSGGIPANRYAKKKPAVNWIQVAAGGALLMFCCLLSIAGVSLFNGLTRSAGEIPSFTAEPSEVVIAESPTASPTLALVNEIVDDFEVKMALVSAGEFMMGSELGDLDEQPVHIVELDAFYMDVYEVTNRSYLDCVSAGVCSPPGKQDNLLTYNSALADYPVTMVDWDMAKTFCEWRGARLPTEAEWEKAARGTDERIYPWGDDISCDFANYDGCQASLSPVGSYPRGVSPYGMYDMAGNVYEWVADHYYDEYYRISPLKNPLGPEFTDVKSIRGGAIRFDTKILRSSMRFAYHPSDRQDYLGFRCASGVTP